MPLGGWSAKGTLGSCGPEPANFLFARDPPKALQRPFCNDDSVSCARRQNWLLPALGPEDLDFHKPGLWNIFRYARRIVPP